VLLVDTRGHGESGGDAMDFGWYGNADIAASVEFLVDRADVDQDRIGAVGLSMGGEQALTAAATDTRIRVVVAEGAEARVAADAERLPDSMQGYTQQMMERIACTAARLLTSAEPPMALRDAVSRMTPRPVLLIAARGEIEGARYFRDASPSSVALWELPAVTHTGALRAHPVEWEQRVVSTLVAGLGPVTPDGTGQEVLT
jgi:pimeloyl-ACP methyl ester carboxylesterase